MTRVFSSRGSRAIFGAFAVAFALVASGRESAASPREARGAGASWMANGAFPSAIRNILYVAPTGCNCVRIYGGFEYKQIGEIDGLDGPGGIATDATGNLWVANYGGNDVLAFHPGSTKPFLTLPVQAFDVVVANDGTVYVLRYAPAEVYVYAPGKTKPSSTIVINGLIDSGAITLDAAGDLLVTGMIGVEQGRVVSIAAGSLQQRVLSPILASPTGIVVDGQGNLVVSDYDNGTTYVIPPGASQPLRTIGAARASRPTFPAFDPTGTKLYVGDGLHAELDIYDYASGRLLRKIPEIGSYETGLSVATSPRAPF